MTTIRKSFDTFDDRIFPAGYVHNEMLDCATRKQEYWAEELKKVKIKLEKDYDDYYEDDGGKYEDDDIVEGEEAEEKGRKVEKIWIIIWF